MISAQNRTDLAAVRSALSTLRANAVAADADQRELAKLARTLEKQIDTTSRAIRGL